MLYRKGEFVRTGDGLMLKCVCCDEDVAIFGKATCTDDGAVTVSYEELYAYSNDETLGRGNDMTALQESRMWEAAKEKAYNG